MNLITHNTDPVFFEDFINNLFGSNIYNDIPPYNIVDNDKALDLSLTQFLVLDE